MGTWRDTWVSVHCTFEWIGDTEMENMHYVYAMRCLGYGMAKKQDREQYPDTE